MTYFLSVFLCAHSVFLCETSIITQSHTEKIQSHTENKSLIKPKLFAVSLFFIYFALIKQKSVYGAGRCF